MNNAAAACLITGMQYKSIVTRTYSQPIFQLFNRQLRLAIDQQSGTQPSPGLDSYGQPLFF